MTSRKFLFLEANSGRLNFIWNEALAYRMAKSLSNRVIGSFAKAIILSIVDVFDTDIIDCGI